MPFNGSKVVQIARARKLKGVDFKRSVFPNRSGNFTWDEIEKATNPNAATIEAIADFLQCSIDDLFDRAATYPSTNVTGSHNTVGSYNVTADPHILAATNRHLQNIIERQDKTIAELNHRIDQLIELAKR